MQKKNNQSETGNYWNAHMPWPVLDRRRPGRGYTHLLGPRSFDAFLPLVPDWQEMQRWLNAIVLAPGDPGTFGWHSPGVIGICAWPRDLWIELYLESYHAEKPLLDMLDVPCKVFTEEDRVLCKFTERTARAHQLLGTLLHEIGHHLDRLTTRSKVKACRGETFARDYQQRTSQLIFDEYSRVFNL